MIKQEVSVELAHQPDLPLKLQFGTHLNDQQILGLLIESIENMAFSQQRQLQHLVIIDTTTPGNYRQVDLKHLKLKKDK